MLAQDLLQGWPVWPNTPSELPRLLDAFKNKKVLVTGGLGTIGSGLLAHLQKVTKPIAIDWNEQLMAERLEHFQENIEWRLGNFHEAKEPFDFVFHCAAYKHIHLSAKFKEAFDINNAHRTELFFKNLLRYSPTLKFIFCSTDKVTGMSELGKSKAKAEQMVATLGGIALRLVNIVGSQGSCIDRWKKEEHPWVGPLHTERYWMSLNDAVRALLQASNLLPGVYTVRDVPLYTLGDFASAFESLYPEKKLIRRTSLREGESDKERLFADEREWFYEIDPIFGRVVPKTHEEKVSA